MKFVTFTGNETLLIGTMSRDGQVLVAANGTFGGGQVSLATIGVGLIVLSIEAFQTAGSRVVFLGQGTELFFSVTGTTTPTINVGLTGEFFKFDTGIYQRT